MVMKIAVMLRTLDLDQGISIYARNLMKSLLKIDRDNQYYFLYSKPQYLGSFGTHANLEEIVVPTRTKLLWDQVGVPLAARRLKADIIFSTKFSVPLLSRAKSMLVLHGSEWYVHPEFYSRLDILYNRVFFPIYCNKAAAISSVSRTSADDIIRFLGLRPEKVHVIHSAISEHFRRVTDPAELARCKAQYRLPDRYILFVGKIYPGKNFANIVRAFKSIRERIGDDVKLVSVGDLRWDYQPELALVKELGLEKDVLFTGWVDQEDLPAIYSLAEVFLFPSFYEGFGIPILEAMACGCPVVTASTGACPEIADAAALFADPRQPGDIAEKVVRVVEDQALAARLVASGLERAKDFSWDLAAARTLDVFRSMVAQR
jgi:glycosyltransferase involved in cell wall biosynthesis